MSRIKTNEVIRDMVHRALNLGGSSPPSLTNCCWTRFNFLVDNLFRGVKNSQVDMGIEDLACEVKIRILRKVGRQLHSNSAKEKISSGRFFNWVFTHTRIHNSRPKTSIHYLWEIDRLLACLVEALPVAQKALLKNKGFTFKFLEKVKTNKVKINELILLPFLSDWPVRMEVKNYDLCSR